MLVAITGASGHIGTNLCRELIAEGHQVRALINHTSKSLEGLQIERIPGNLLDKKSLELLVSGSDVIIHLAAIISIQDTNESDLLSININGTRNILDIVNKIPVRRFIHFSSIHALIQEPYDQVLDETRPLALKDPTLYSRTKAWSEQLVLDAINNGLNGLIINPTSILGPNDFRPSLMGKAILQICQNKFPGLVAGGYDWVDVRDVVAGTLQAIEKGRTGERYLLSGKWLSLPDLVRVISQFYPVRNNHVILPYWLAELGVPFLKIYASLRRTEPLYTHQSLDTVRHSHQIISSEKAKNELGYQPRPIEMTIRDTIEWFKINNYL